MCQCTCTTTTAAGPTLESAPLEAQLRNELGWQALVDAGVFTAEQDPARMMHMRTSNWDTRKLMRAQYTDTGTLRAYFTVAEAAEEFRRRFL